MKTILTVEGFKSIVKPVSIELKPITVFAGANSSGKSSFMQPFLLLKQTYQSDYAVEGLKLDGPNVRFDNFEEFSKKILKIKNAVHVGNLLFSVNHELKKNGEIQINKIIFIESDGFGVSISDSGIYINEEFVDREEFDKFWSSYRHEFEANIYSEFEISMIIGVLKRRFSFMLPSVEELDFVEVSKKYFFETSVVHIPGIRIGSLRVYPNASVKRFEIGTFDYYIGALSKYLNEDENQSQLEKVVGYLSNLELGKGLVGEKITDASIRVLVNDYETNSLRNIADMGLAVSQILPLLQALVVSNPVNTIYCEQPEIHLHPNAQYKLAEVISNSLKQKDRYKSLIIETHSSLLIQGLLTEVAKGNIKKEDLGLYWFSRDEEGHTVVTAAEIDDEGSYGNWPIDFDTVYFKAVSEHIVAKIK